MILQNYCNCMNTEFYTSQESAVLGQDLRRLVQQTYYK